MNRDGWMSMDWHREDLKHPRGGCTESFGERVSWLHVLVIPLDLRVTQAWGHFWVLRLRILRTFLWMRQLNGLIQAWIGEATTIYPHRGSRISGSHVSALSRETAICVRSLVTGAKGWGSDTNIYWTAAMLHALYVLLVKSCILR